MVALEGESISALGVSAASTMQRRCSSKTSLCGWRFDWSLLGPDVIVEPTAGVADRRLIRLSEFSKKPPDFEGRHFRKFEELLNRGCFSQRKKITKARMPRSRERNPSQTDGITAISLSSIE
jgi:hypothetical protein